MPKGTAPADLIHRLQGQAISAQEWKKVLVLQDELDKKEGYDAYSAITRYRIFALSGKPKKAIKEIDRYLETDPTNMRFLLFRLEIMEQMGAKPKELYALYERVLKIDPYNLMILNNYAYHLATHGGDLTKAEKMSAITIQEQPSNPTFLDTYGWILHLQGQDQLALFYLNKALWNLGNDEKMRDEVQKHIHSIK
jgi:tetratricopeptide (TPR) repeat protein